MSDELPEFDYLKLDRALDRVKSKVFMSRNGSAFFGPLLSGMEFYWDTGIETACTDGVRLWWNPQFFLDAAEKYNEPRFNEFVLRHELWHVAKLHNLRRGSRDPDLWNYACDVRNNNDLKRDGYSWGSFPAWYMPHLDDGKKEDMTEEDIYDELFKKGFQVPENPWGNDELREPDELDKQRTINNIVRSKTQAEIEDRPQDVPGGTQGLIDHFLAAKIPWEQTLLRWMTDLKKSGHSWKRPRRRMMSQNIYLPERTEKNDRLAHLMYMLDTSGSVSAQEIQRFNSELKYVWDYIKPKRMTVVQFDDEIRKVDEYKIGDEFVKVEVKGRGGNNMWPVHAYITEHEPTAAIIFTDLQYTPMAPLEKPIPVLWVTGTNCKIDPPYGDVIRVQIDHRLYY